jgi:hypothetical protein
MTAKIRVSLGNERFRRELPLTTSAHGAPLVCDWGKEGRRIAGSEDHDDKRFESASDQNHWQRM